MPMENILTQLESVVTGIIATFAADRLSSLQAQMAIKQFEKELQNWANQFIVDKDRRVLTTYAFFVCARRFDLLNAIVGYVFDPRDDVPPEKAFLDDLYKKMVSAVQEEQEKELSPGDKRLIREFLEGLHRRAKAFLFENSFLKDIEARYTRCQTKIGVNTLIEGGIPAQPQPQPSPPGYQPPKYRLSSNNLTARDYFLEGSREEELSTLSNALETEQEVFIWGLGGMGKSMLALKLVERLGREAYRLQYRDSMENTLLKLTFADGTREYRYQPQSGLTPEEQKRAELQERLTMLKESHGDALFIVDNFDTEGRNVNAMLAEEACQNLRDLGVKLIYTTRCPCGERWAELRPLSGDDLLKVMEQITQHAYPADALRPLIEAVHGHTLMVVLMARTLRESYGDVTPETILTALKEHTVSEADFPEVHSHKNRDFLEAQLYAHMKALFDLTNLAEPARNVLRCAALLPDGGMAGDLFQSCILPPRKPFLKRLLERLMRRKKEPALSEEREWVNKLEKTGWLARSGNLLTIHPVVREVCLEELKPDMATCGPFLDKLSEQYQTTKYSDYNAVRYRQMAECLACAARLLKDDKTGEWALWAGFLYNRLGDYRAALEQNLKAVALREAALPPDHPDLAASYNNVGSTYSALGDHKQALEYKEKDLAICERVLSPDHPDLAASYNNVGTTYGDLGDHKQALEYKEKALDIWERVLPPDHPALAVSYNNVGYTYGDLGDHNKALEYLKKALDIRERVLSPDHPDLASSYNNVGMTYGDLGDHNKALEYLKKALDIRERVLSPDHPDLAQSYNNVGGTYSELGDHNKALEYLKKALDIRERVLSPDHPDLASSYNNVGGTYFDFGMGEKEQGNEEKAAEYLEKALGCMKQALEILEQKLPPYHPHLRGCRENIAVAYLVMGDEERAARWLDLAKATPPPPGTPAP